MKDNRVSRFLELKETTNVFQFQVSSSGPHSTQSKSRRCNVYDDGSPTSKRRRSTMRTTEAQISLRIRTVWSAPLLFAD